MAQFAESLGAEVREFMLFPVRPQIFDWIQFRSVGGLELQPDASLLFPHEVPDDTSPMAPEPIPYHQQLAWNVTQQVREKLDDLRTANCVTHGFLPTLCRASSNAIAQEPSLVGVLSARLVNMIGTRA